MEVDLPVVLTQSRYDGEYFREHWQGNSKLPPPKQRFPAESSRTFAVDAVSKVSSQPQRRPECALLADDSQVVRLRARQNKDWTLKSEGASATGELDLTDFENTLAWNTHLPRIR